MVNHFEYFAFNTLMSHYSEFVCHIFWLPLNLKLLGFSWMCYSFIEVYTSLSFHKESLCYWEPYHWLHSPMVVSIHLLKTNQNTNNRVIHLSISHIINPWESPIRLRRLSLSQNIGLKYQQPIRYDFGDNILDYGFLVVMSNKQKNCQIRLGMIG